MKLKYFKKIKTEAQAHKRFRDLSKKFHPDTNSGADPEIFKEISEEYSEIVIYFRVLKKQEIPEGKPAEKSKPKIDKVHADEIITSTSDIVKTGLQILAKKFLDIN